MPKPKAECRCLGQDFDSGNACDCSGECARWIDITQEHPADTLIISTYCQGDPKPKAKKK